MILTPVMKGEAWLAIAREINRRAAEIPEPPPPRPTPPDPFPLVAKQWAVGCMEWQAEQDALAAAARAGVPPLPAEASVAPALLDDDPPTQDDPARRMPSIFASARARGLT